MENKFKQVTLRIFKLLPFEKQYVSVATDAMIEYKDKDINYHYVEFVEYAADEQLKEEIKKIEEINDRALSSAPFQEITALKSKLAKAKENLNTALNYLHWREDDLIGDDCIGDGRLTAEYKNKVSEIEKSISEIGEG